MTDHKLLEAAAKAAGIEYVWEPFWHDKPGWMMKTVGGHFWSPLTDDGDALRLAVKLNIVPRRINGVVFAWADGVCDAQEPANDDPYAATRRAIVRAAAEMGNT